jgi:hydrogenase-4 component E
MTHVYEVSRFLAGLMLLASFSLLYQDRIAAVLNTFAAQAVLLSMAVGWEAWTQDRPHLFITAALALGLKAIIIPVALRRMVDRLGLTRGVEKVVGVGSTLMIGLALTALALLLVLRVTASAESFTREGLALALAIVLLGLLMMITRRSVVTQIVGFMSLENGLILAATGARGMPLVFEISVAFSVLIALLVFGVFVFDIHDRFEGVGVEAIERMRGDRE